MHSVNISSEKSLKFTKTAANLSSSFAHDASSSLYFFALFFKLPLIPPTHFRRAKYKRHKCVVIFFPSSLCRRQYVSKKKNCRFDVNMNEIYVKLLIRLGLKTGVEICLTKILSKSTRTRSRMTDKFKKCS